MVAGSGMKMWCLVGLTAQLRIPLVIRPMRHTYVVMLLLSEELMSCCAAGTNGCLDLRRRAFALDQGSPNYGPRAKSGP